MRNLRNIRRRVCRTTPADISAVCWDAARDQVLVAHGPTEEDAKITLVRVTDGKDGVDVAGSGAVASQLQLQRRTVASWEAPSPSPDLAVDKVVNLHHFSDTATSCLVLAGGDIVIVQEKDGLADSEEAHIEIVGSIDAGITAARWSPDEELLVITTVANTVVFMSRSFDPVAEAAFSPDDLKLSKQVSVGWGKKETQFQGKGAKAKGLRDPTIPERVDEGVLSPLDDQRTTISWRGDGAFVAINSIESGIRRVIRIYSREGLLESVSEPVDGLEGSLSWRPAGNLMAGIQRLENRIDVVFFERNGLRHGEFTLRISNSSQNTTEDIALEWNSDSTVLAVALKDRVQLWTMGNYHWYLKQEVLSGQSRPSIAWHPEKALSLASATSSKLLLEDYIFTVTRGPVAPPFDFGAVAVIDGQTVKLTPFRTANVPPPMSAFDLEVGSSVVDVAFAADNSAFAVLHLDGVDFYSWETRGTRSLAPKLVDKASFGLSGTVRCDQSQSQIGFSGARKVLVLRMTPDLNLGAYVFESSSPKSWEWSEIAGRPVRTMTTLPTTVQQAGVVAQDNLGALFQLAGEGKESWNFKFPTLLPWTEFVRHEGEIVGFGLSRSGHLYANSRQLIKNCTSFLVTNDHLIFTTSNHFVKFIHLASPEGLEVPSDDPENDERCRSIERGAKLVTAMPTNMSIVLQMPRGNLETIFPRAMVLAGIRSLIDEKNYERAFSFCRTQRVDMNLLYDHQPEQFLENVALFLDQLKDVTYIDLFLSSLREEDVTKTMYKDTKSSKPQASILPQATLSVGLASPGQASKVNTVCDAVLKALRVQKNANLQNIITANVCKNPPAVEDGLAVVAELMQEDESLAERAVEHICFLVDVNRVYDQALGLYNLDLALLVAQQSQRDPREYLPFIQNLHQTEPMRRQFAIDDHLERRDRALAHLQKLGVFEEVEKYTVKYDLYKAALGLYRYDEQHHKILTDLYAVYLESHSKFREAGLAYESLGNYAKATACYQAAGSTCWQECLSVAQQQNPPLSSDVFADIASSLADALYEAKDYAAAAIIYTDYLSSVVTAARYLCKGYHFAEAIRLVLLKQRSDLLENTIDPGLADALSSSTEFLADCNAQLKAQVPRILELRQKAIEDPLAFYEGERPFGAAGGDIPDDVSIAPSTVSTNASLFTRYTGKAGSVGTVGSNVSRATSKNRRREEKKRARGRKGTVYEQEYLVNSVRRLIERVGAAKDEVERLVFGLARRGMAERARAIEALMSDVLEACKVTTKEVWPEGDADANGTEAQFNADEGDVGLGQSYTGGQAVFHETLELMKAKQTPPLVASLERLSLLGS